jgi:hypothetical protein
LLDRSLDLHCIAQLVRVGLLQSVPQCSRMNEFLLVVRHCTEGDRVRDMVDFRLDCSKKGRLCVPSLFERSTNVIQDNVGCRQERLCLGMLLVLLLI